MRDIIYSHLSYYQLVREEVREKVKQAAHQPNTFDGQHPITQLATAYSAGIEALAQLQEVYEVITDIRNIVSVLNSLHEENMDCSVGLPSLNIALERLPEWKESPIDDILKNHSMKVMYKQRYDELTSKKGNNEYSNS